MTPEKAANIDRAISRPQRHKVAERLIATVVGDLEDLKTGGHRTQSVLLRCEALLTEARGVLSGEVNLDDVDAINRPAGAPTAP